MPIPGVRRLADSTDARRVMAGSGGIGSGATPGNAFGVDAATAPAPLVPVSAPAGDYRAPSWLPGRHAQTLWPALLAPRPTLAWRRERWDAPDGDFVDLDWAVPPPGAARAPARPLLALFHGLEGSSDSPYARVLMAEALARGLDGVVIHFRGCSGTPTGLPRA